MANQNEEYIAPLGNFNFLVKAGSETQGQFVEVTGLKGEVEEYEIKEGGLNDRTHRLPGRVSWGPITLKHGIFQDNKFVEEWWDKVVQDPKNCMKDLTITLLAPDGSEARSWDIRGAWPKSWEGTGMNASGSETAIETLVLSHQGINVKKI